MNIKLYISILLIGIITIMSGCKKDNYDPPKSLLTGQVTYKGQPVGVGSNDVQLELWQHGYKLFTKIPVYVKQDGQFSAMLFDGNYKLTAIPGNGPWVSSTDSIDVHVNGNTSIDFPVTPYFLVDDASYDLTDGMLNAEFTITKITNDKELEKVTLFLGETTITDAINNDATFSKSKADISDLNNPVTLQLQVPSKLLEKGYFFARVGVKTKGVAEYLYSTPQKIVTQ